MRKIGYVLFALGLTIVSAGVQQLHQSSRATARTSCARGNLGPTNLRDQ